MRRKKNKINRFYEFENLCLLSQKEMKAHLFELLKDRYENVISADGYVFAEGTVPVLLLAHMDTMHKELPKVFYYAEGSNIISSPQGIGGDDRCGIYMILEIIKELHCSVLFLEDEEIGCVGAGKFASDYENKRIDELKVNYMIEFDRRGANDAVYYDLDNLDFEDFITFSSDGHFETNFGSCSDICYVAPAIGVAAVNLSCGYYKEHQLDHYVNRKEMEKNIEMAKQIIRADVTEPFAWKEYIRFSNRKNWFDWDWSSYSYGKGKYDDDEFEILFVDEDGVDAVDYFVAANEEEAIGMFMKAHMYVRYADVYSVVLTDKQHYTSADRFYIDGELEEFDEEVKETVAN